MKQRNMDTTFMLLTIYVQ